jgi:hypothetical protein
MGCSSSAPILPSGALSPATGAELPQEIHVFLTKNEGATLGAHVKANRWGEPVITSVYSRGLLQEWNRRNPDKKVQVGYRLIGVNGVHGYFWPMMFELQNAGRSHLVFLRANPEELRQDSAEIGEVTASQALVDSLPRMSAGDCDATECAICFDDMSRETRVVVLPCNHAFHPECAEKWLVNRKGTCPLCSLAVTEETVNGRCCSSGRVGFRALAPESADAPDSVEIVEDRPTEDDEPLSEIPFSVAANEMPETKTPTAPSDDEMPQMRSTPMPREMFLPTAVASELRYRGVA